MMYNQPSIEVCDDWLKTIASVDRCVFCCRLGPTATTTSIRQFHVGYTVDTDGLADDLA